MTRQFQLESEFHPAGDQPEAIEALLNGIEVGELYQTLLGVTGSGKTFTMAHLIASTGRTTLILAPNKTLAAQLYAEMRDFFPGNAVEYFVSYYDYYQPEAYVPSSDTYIEKDASIGHKGASGTRGYNHRCHGFSNLWPWGPGGLSRDDPSFEAGGAGRTA